MERKVLKKHIALYTPMGELLTWRSMPSNTLDYLDPFLFLNHHGPAIYPPFSQGLPFGPHPHRGFETLTFVFEGDVMHKDSTGGQSTIGADGVQWMTAGRGIIHTEISSEEFKEKGGTVHLIQLWMNLPKSLKMTPPNYQGFSATQIPIIQLHEGLVVIHLVSGEFMDQNGPANSITNLFTSWIDFKPGGVLSLDVDSEREVLLYVVGGSLLVNGMPFDTHTQLQFENVGNEISISASTESRILLCHGKPYNEPVAAQGPFVMNTQSEIMEAMRDYQMGKMGVWID